VTITHSTLATNLGEGGGGGIFNDSGGTVTMTDSTLASNSGIDPGFSGGITNFGTLTITNSTLSGNAGRFGAGGIENGGTVTLLNSTLSGNHCVDCLGGGIGNFGTLTITNSTLSDNAVRGFGQGGGLFSSGGTVAVQNTILALNTARRGPDCAGPVTSFDHNLIGTMTGCTLTLQPNDLTGDPGLAAFTDDGTPGNGHYPLLPTSRAIDAGNDAACPPTDQLGQPRVGPCDIGAIEFQGGELVAAGRGHQGPQ
jgi:hypothetical protein